MDTPRILSISEPDVGLEAIIAIDSTQLGPAVGGIRTRVYASRSDAEREALQLARAMTIKCALAGLPAGGGKAVILERADWDRRKAFARFGERVEALSGLFRTAGDLGTTHEDLAVMAETCSYVHTDERSLSQSVARGWLTCLGALARDCQRDLEKESVLVMGCGAIGSAVARAAAQAGLQVVLADVDPTRAASLALEIGARVIDAEDCLLAPVGVLAPCAIGGVIDRALAGRLLAWGVCGAANNVFVDRDAEAQLDARGIRNVPDVLASAGAVVDGIGHSLMSLEDRGPLIDALGDTAARILHDSRTQGVAPGEVAAAMAVERIRSTSKQTFR